MSGDIKTGQFVDAGVPQQEQLDQLEAALKSSPRMLESALLTLTDRYVYTKTDEGAYLTPDTVIDMGDDLAHGTTIFVGYTEQDYHRKVIFQKDTASGRSAEWIVFSGFPNTQIADGNGRPIESDDECQYVQSIIEAIKLSYEQDVTQKADTFDIKRHLITAIEGQIAAAEAEIAAKRLELASLDEQRLQTQALEAPLNKFKVTIHSGWEREGEQSLDEVISAASPSEALRQATLRFKELNRRSDVQARAFSVSVSVGDKGNFYPLPDEVVAPIFRALSRWDREEHDLEAAKQSLRTLGEQ